MVKLSDMVKSTRHKNMSYSVDRSSEHDTHDTHNTHSDSGSFSADFAEIDSPMIVLNNAGRMGKDDFGGRRGVEAKVIFGNMMYEGDIYEFEWNEEQLTVNLSWKSKCNLLGEEGIACDDGSGWSEWNDNEKCYIAHGDDTCMKIFSENP